MGNEQCGTPPAPPLYASWMSPPATLLMWFQLRSPELAEDFERLMTEDRDIVRGSLDTVSNWRLARPADVPGRSIGQADYVLIAEIVEVERFEQQASEHVQPLGGGLGASRFEPGDARPASRPLNPRTVEGDQACPRSELEMSRITPRREYPRKHEGRSRPRVDQRRACRQSQERRGFPPREH
jgi:hypothetical protein